MSDSQTIWAILWDHAKAAKGPFEIDDVLPDAAKALGKSGASLQRQVTSLIDELDRMPEGRQYFETEGNAAVPLPEFFAAVAQGKSPTDTYPYEL